MIRDLFLPTRIGKTYLFPQRIVAFEIGTDTIRATKIHAHRSLATLSAYIEEPCITAKPESVAHAITMIKERIGKWDELHICLPGNRAIFKRLSLPFTNQTKIRLVLPFELEPVLPFPVEEAVFDALVMPAAGQENEASNIFVATIKKDVLDQYVKPFLGLGLVPQRVTLAGIELYGFIQTLNNNLVKTGPIIVVDIDNATTDILLLVDGMLMGMRSFAEGIEATLHQRAVASLTPDEYRPLASLIREINFSMQALGKSEHVAARPTRLLLTGAASSMEGLVQAIEHEVGIPTSRLHPHDIMHIPWINMDHQGVLPSKFIKSFATALPRSVTEEFDLGRRYHEASDLSSFKKKLIVTAFLIGMLLGVAIFNSLRSGRTLRKELEASRTELEKRLVTEFKLLKKPSGTGIKGLLDEAQKKLTFNEGIWSSLTTDRYSFLTYLQALSTHINRTELGLELKKLSIKRDPLTGEDKLALEGSVKGFSELRMLETALQDTKLFKPFTRGQEPKFNFSLTINKEGDFR
ncbi:MAG: hypothetical protein M1549_01305 [Candidatus Dependentiae bacterium]|nr:hypothetical protein [Candidatus Dependentiae bacterium]